MSDEYDVKIIHDGKPLVKGKISEWVYEDFIDEANYCGGENLKNTLLWEATYERGFVCKYEGYWLAFAYWLGDPYYLGAFEYDEVFKPEESPYHEYYHEVMSSIDNRPVPEAIELLAKVYLDPRAKNRTTKAQKKMAEDKEAKKWLADYWEYVCWNEHGNQASLEEVQWYGMVDTILDPEYVHEYLEDRPDLLESLDKLHAKYKRYAE